MPGEPAAANTYPLGSLNPDRFYLDLTSRNRGLVPVDEQSRLRAATILVAGCGSIGGAAVEPLVRIGAEHLVLAEPDAYELHNLNRQGARIQDVGRNKAEVLAERSRDVNPHAQIEVEAGGVHAGNVGGLIDRAAVVIDGVDVTTKGPLAAKVALHHHAARKGVPVISGYDIAGLQQLLVYDYSDPRLSPLGGRLDSSTIEDLEPDMFLARVVGLRHAPLEILPVLRRRLAGEDESFPQLVYTANQFGVLAVRATLDLLSGRRVRHRTIVDVDHLLRPYPDRIKAQVARVAGMCSLARDVRRLRRAVTR